MNTQSNKIKIKILLVDEDFSLSQWVTQYFYRFLQPENSEIHVVHVLPPKPHPISIQLYMGGIRDMHYPTLTEKERVTIVAEEEREGYSILKRTCNLLEKSGINATPVLIRGDAINEIVKYAKEEEIELIVVGASKSNTVLAWRPYIFIRKLMKCSSCPVLVVTKPWQFESMSSNALDFLTRSSKHDKP